MKKFVKELLSTDYSLQRKTKPFPLYINTEERQGSKRYLMCKKKKSKQNNTLYFTEKVAQILHLTRQGEDLER